MFYEPVEASSITKSRWRRYELVMILALLLSPIAFSPYGVVVSHYKALYINLTATLLIGAFIFRSLFNCGFRFIPTKVDIAWILFVAFGALSYFWSINSTVYLQRLTLLIAITVGYLIVRVRTAEGDNSFNYVLIIVIVGALVAALDSGLILYYRWIATAGAEEGYKVSSSFFPHDNVASLYVVFLIPLNFCTIFCIDKVWKKLICSLMLVMLMVYLLILESRAATAEAILALILISICILFRAKFIPFFEGSAKLLKKKPVIIFLVLLLVAAFLLPLSKEFSAWAKALFMDVVNTFDLNFKRSFFRLDIWRRTVRMISDNFTFGVGLGNFPVYFPLYHKLVHLKSHPHSEYFNILSELGVIGASFYFFFLIMLLRTFINSFTRCVGKERILALGLGCALLMEVLHGFIEPPMIFEASALNMLICAGLLVSLDAKAMKRKAIEFNPGRGVKRYLLPAITTVGLILAVPWLAVGFTLGYNFKNAVEAEEKNDFAEAERRYRLISNYSWGGSQIQMDIGKACFKQGKYGEALAEYIEAEKLFPYYFKVHYEMGCVLNKLNRHHEAIEQLTQCLIYNPRFIIANAERIRVYRKLKDYDSTLKYLKSYLRPRKSTISDCVFAAECYLEAYLKSDFDDSRKTACLSESLKLMKKAKKLNNEMSVIQGGPIEEINSRIDVRISLIKRYITKDKEREEVITSEK